MRFNWIDIPQSEFRNPHLESSIRCVGGIKLDWMIPIFTIRIPHSAFGELHKKLKRESKGGSNSKNK